MPQRLMHVVTHAKEHQQSPGTKTEGGRLPTNPGTVLLRESRKTESRLQTEQEESFLQPFWLFLLWSAIFQSLLGNNHLTLTSHKVNLLYS